MCSSIPRSRRPGLSLVEALLAVLILAVAGIPLVQLLASARRAGHSAERMLQAGLHGQTILDAVCALSPDELPGASDAETEWEGAGGVQPGTGRWDEVRAYLAAPPPFPLERRILARRFPDGTVLVRVELAWRRVVDQVESRTVRSFTGLVGRREGP